MAASTDIEEHREAQLVKPDSCCVCRYPRAHARGYSLYGNVDGAADDSHDGVADGGGRWRGILGCLWHVCRLPCFRVDIASGDR